MRNGVIWMVVEEGLAPLTTRFTAMLDAADLSLLSPTGEVECADVEGFSYALPHETALECFRLGTPLNVFVWASDGTSMMISLQHAPRGGELFTLTGYLEGGPSARFLVAAQAYGEALCAAGNRCWFLLDDDGFSEGFDWKRFFEAPFAVSGMPPDIIAVPAEFEPLLRAWAPSVHSKVIGPCVWKRYRDWPEET
jgi:hypothetical protein